MLPANSLCSKTSANSLLVIDPFKTHLEFYLYAISGSFQQNMPCFFFFYFVAACETAEADPGPLQQNNHTEIGQKNLEYRYFDEVSSILCYSLRFLVEDGVGFLPDCFRMIYCLHTKW